MIVRLLYNSSEADRIGKKYSLVREMDCVFKQSADVLDIDITITSDSLPNANYMYIPILNRFYFITDIVNLREGLWQIAGHVDVLETYKDEIKAQVGVIGRNENKYNLYLNDDRFTVEQETQIQKLLFNSNALLKSRCLVVVASQPANAGAI